MFENDAQSKIFSYFSKNNTPASTAFDYLEFKSDDNYNVYIVASLFSNHVKDLNDYIDLAINEARKKFLVTQLPILDRMKESIFHSGDFLANHLIDAKEEVEDVDYSVCIVAFKDNIVYVWIDGSLNVRLYRGENSILVNTEESTQFFGSTEVFLGDIFAVSYSQNLDQEDLNSENYVLEKKEISYPSLYLDYQIEANLETSPVVNTEISVEEASEKDLVDEEYDREEFDNEIAEAPVNKRLSRNKLFASKPNINFSETIDKIKNKLQDLRRSQIWKIIIEKIKLGAKFIYSLLFKFTSSVIDFIYSLLAGANPHKLKRFQSSYKKRNLQYLLMFVIVVSSFYLIFLRGGNETTKIGPANNANTNNSAAQKTAETKKSIETQFNRVKDSFALIDISNINFSSIEFANFDKAYNDLQSTLTTAKNSGFTDTAFISSIEGQSQDFYNRVFKVKGIDRVAVLYSATNMPNAKLVDFSVLKGTVYAIDNVNSKILKSNSDSLQFEEFASNQNFSNLTQIACAVDACYVLDADKGFAYLDLTNKKLVAIPGLENAGQNVKEMAFAFNNIYTLVPAEKRVVKYARDGAGLKQGVTWNVEPGFDADTEDFYIDGNIFEISSAGELKRYYLNKYDPSIAGLEKSSPILGSKLQLAMTAARVPGQGQNRVYVGDPTNKMIAIYNKDPNAAKQYQFLGAYRYQGTEKVSFNDIQEMLLLEDERSLYILGNNSVYQITVAQV